MEKEITGFYITGHPLEEYREKIQYLTTIESLEKQKRWKICICSRNYPQSQKE